MLVLVVVVSLLMILDPLLDFLQIRRNKYIQYAGENRLAAIGYGLAASVSVATGEEFKEVIGILVLIPGVRWIVHDYLLNLYRGLPLSYLGERSKLDQFLSVLPKSVMPITFKIYILLFSIWIAFLIQLV